MRSRIALVSILVAVGCGNAPSSSSSTEDTGQLAKTQQAEKADGPAKPFDEVAWHLRAKPDSGVDPTKICASTPFQPNRPAGYTIYSIETNSETARYTNWEKEPVGTLVGCFDVHPGLTPYPVYGAYYFNTGEVFVFNGTCQIALLDTPQTGVNQSTCILPITSAPPGFVGGLATTNTLAASPALGYNTTSLATIRIFKPHRTEDDRHG